ncbi:MAG: Rv3235 family protein, partial [Frankiaceae bacterium]|nr:Rv3235 family protein [Frankiaceae bacterium]
RHAALPVVEGFRNDPAAWARLAPHRRPGVVRTVRASAPSESCAEFSAVVQVGPRFRAVAARLERTADGWRCTRLQIG